MINLQKLVSQPKTVSCPIIKRLEWNSEGMNQSIFNRQEQTYMINMKLWLLQDTKHI